MFLKFFYKSSYVISGFLALCIMLLAGCKKFVDVAVPVTDITGETVFQSDATAIAVMNGIYSRISGATFDQPGGLTTMSLYLSLYTDELKLWNNVTNPAHNAYYQNDLAVNIAGHEFWINNYPLVFICNSVIDGVGASTSLTSVVKSQLLGEAHFTRAFIYYYLVNLYGDVPLVLTTNYKTNSSITRNSIQQVYEQIVQDLLEAKQLLHEEFPDASLVKAGTDRIRPTKAAAAALLTRAYLSTGKWKEAEEEASFVINNTALFSLEDAANTFQKNNQEAIWQLQPVTTGTITNTQDAFYFILPATGPNSTTFNGQPVYLTPQLVSEFEPNDARKANWTDSVVVNSTTYYYPYKYKVNDNAIPSAEYLMVFRLAEMYLARAEARARQDKTIDALDDLNEIKARAGVTLANLADQNSLIDEILHERKLELFTEWGHRWFDLLRANKAAAIMPSVAQSKGGAWEAKDLLFPIPLTEIQRNKNLTQNAGY